MSYANGPANPSTVARATPSYVATWIGLTILLMAFALFLLSLSAGEWIRDRDEIAAAILILFSTGLLYVSGGFLRLIWSTRRLTFHADGFGAPGAPIIRWSEVQRVAPISSSRGAIGIRLDTAQGSTKILTILFRDSDVLLRLIRDRVEGARHLAADVE